ncbi:hypothetical protein DOY81_012862 [Sarcophaga bullata]|nr:hypothetical protein DOY81_012862 [Sarcophaga bullata]
MLWGIRCLQITLGDFLKEVNVNFERIEFHPPSQASTSNLLRRALDRSSTRTSLSKNSKITWRRLDSAEVVHVSRICAMYYAALNTLSQLKLEILTGICFVDKVFYDLWLFITSLGPNCALKEFLELFKCEDFQRKPQTAMLMLFCDSNGTFVT